MLFRSLFSGVVSISFSGSRCPTQAAVSALGYVLQAVPSGVQVCVGCASGVDAVVRTSFHGSPHLQVFSVSEFPSLPPRAALAARSARCVEAGQFLVAVPGDACPSGVRPSRSFSGQGSGTWGSVALAAGLGRRCLVWLPPVVSPPAWSGFEWSCVESAPGGQWWLVEPAHEQLSLF